MCFCISECSSHRIDVEMVKNKTKQIKQSTKQTFSLKHISGSAVPIKQGKPILRKKAQHGADFSAMAKKLWVKVLGPWT